MSEQVKTAARMWATACYISPGDGTRIPVVSASDYDALAQRFRELEKVSDDAIGRNTFLETECDDLRTEVERMRNPSDDMLVAGQEVWARGRIGALEDCEEAHAIYMAMIDSSMEATR